MRKLLVAATAFVLAGCGGHPLDCATGLVAWNDCSPGSAGFEKRARAEASDEVTCQSYGLQPGTDEFVRCRAAFRMNRDNANQAVETAAWGNFAHTVAAAPQAARPSYQPSSTLSCTSRTMGATTFTDCQ